MPPPVVAPAGLSTPGVVAGSPLATFPLAPTGALDPGQGFRPLAAIWAQDQGAVVGRHGHIGQQSQSHAGGLPLNLLGIA